MSTVRTPVTETLTNAIRTDYESGNFTQAELATKHTVSIPTVNRLVKGCAKPAKRKYTHKTSKFAERNSQVLLKAQAGASTRELAVEFGVTHQNISLILKKAGFTPIDAHKERLAVRATARNEKLAAQKQAKVATKMEKVNALSALWKSGAKIGEIREAAGLKSDNAAQVKIVLLRRKHPELFPKRPAFGRSAEQTAEAAGEKLVKVEKLSAAWKADKSVEECATEVGWTAKTFSRTLPHLRKTYGVEVFPYRRNPKAGKSEAELEQELDTPEFTNHQ
jgi:transcriptional regulator with XRE-family HTH domain